MCALFPPMFTSSNYGWPLDGAISHEQNYITREAETTKSFPHIPPSHQDKELNIDYSTSFTAHSDPSMVKKLNHNASERDRRKKINGLYSSLRSFLPAADQSKKLSIPATVSRVLKYIPELQQQVERLIQKKEELLSKISTQDNVIHQEMQRRSTLNSTLSTVSTSWLGDREIVIQVSTFKVHNIPLSTILLNLEEDGLTLLNSSSFESSEGRVFYNLHLQMEGPSRLECGALSQKLASLY